MKENRPPRLSSLDILKYIKKSEILTLLIFFESDKDLKKTQEFNDINVLYEFYKSHFMDDFIPEVVLAYIYAYSPLKHPRLPKLSLYTTIEDMKQVIDKFEVYNVKKIGIGRGFQLINEIEGIKQIQTRENVWEEAIRMNAFLKSYRFWPKKWESTRGIYHYIDKANKEFVLVIRKIDYRYIIIEALGRDGEIMSQNNVRNIQFKINQFLTERL